MLFGIEYESKMCDKNINIYEKYHKVAKVALKLY